LGLGGRAQPPRQSSAHSMPKEHSVHANLALIQC
jgi:hypothetical protein